MTTDPDAMWRPGYTGPIVVRPSPEPPSARRPARRAIAAGAIAVVIALGVGVTTVVRSSDDGRPSSATGTRIPTVARQRWSVTIDAVAVTVVGGSTDTIIAVTGSDPQEIIALDGGTGAERWSTSDRGGGVHSVVVVGDVVVTTALGGDGQTVRGLDAASGRELWTRPTAGSVDVDVEAGRIVLVRYGGDSLPGPTLDLVDPLTGAVESSVGGAGRSSRSVVQVPTDDGGIEVFDPRTLRSLGVVDLSLLGLAGVPGTRVAITDAGAVVATTTSVMLVDDDRVVSTVGLNPLPVGGSGAGLEVLDDAGRYVAVQQGDHLVVLATDGGMLRRLWSTTGWLADWHVDAERQLVAVAQVTGSVVALPPEILDVATGESSWDGPASVQRSSPLRVFGDNGFIAVTAPRSTSADEQKVVVGYDLDRSELWRVPVGSRSTIGLVDGGLLTIDRHLKADTNTLTLYS